MKKPVKRKRDPEVMAKAWATRRKNAKAKKLNKAFEAAGSALNDAMFGDKAKPLFNVKAIADERNRLEQPPLMGQPPLRDIDDQLIREFIDGVRTCVTPQTTVVTMPLSAVEAVVRRLVATGAKY